MRYRFLLSTITHAISLLFPSQHHQFKPFSMLLALPCELVCGVLQSLTRADISRCRLVCQDLVAITDSQAFIWNFLLRHNSLPLDPTILSHVFMVPSFIHILSRIAGEGIHILEFARDFSFHVETRGSRILWCKTFETFEGYVN